MASSLSSSEPSATDQPSRPPATTRKRRQKTFTGCWTCRGRHVKCDEQRPECKRCLTGNFACQGYGTRLTWLAPAGKTPSTKSQQAAPDSPHAPVTEGHRISKASARAPSSRKVATTKWKAFTVFPASLPDDRDAQPETVAPGRRKRPSIAPSKSPAPTEPNAYDPSLLGPEFTIPFHLSADASIPSLQGPSYQPSGGFDNLSWEEANAANFTGAEPWEWDGTTMPLGGDGNPVCFGSMSTSASSLDSSSTGSQGSEADQDDCQFHQGRQSPALGSPRIQLDILPASPRHRELINHWATNLCHKLLPIRSSINPFLVVVSPIALVGSRMANDPDHSSGAVALFHAVCAVSAAHQENLKGATSEDSAVTLHHKRLSFYHLMRNMHSTNLDDRMASLSTLCLWLLTHFISGEPGSWREVVKVTRNLLQETASETWTKSATASATYQSFSSFITLVQTQYLGRGEYPAPMKPDLAGSDIYKAMATPDQSLELISSFNSSLLQGHIVTSEKMDQMEIEFALSAPSSPGHLRADSHEHTMAQHHSSLFYYACLLYFRCVSGRRGREDDIHDLVARCLGHMESLDAMRLDGSPRVWVYATVAFEASTPELRNRVRAIFRHRTPLAFRSWDTVLLAAEEIWRQRDVTPPGWELEPWPQLLARMPEFDVVFY